MFAPLGAISFERRHDLASCKTKVLYWVEGEYDTTGFRYRDVTHRPEIRHLTIDRLNLTWSGPFFENYFYAYAYWLKVLEHDHGRDKTTASGGSNP